MVLVDIYVPGVNRTYDFNLDENAEVSLLIEEISGLICQKEQCRLKGNVKELLLVSKRLKCVLSPEASLAYYEVVSGDRLLLV